MMYYIESPSRDPYFNLSLEQYVFDKLPRSASYFMLWQNDNAVIVGKHQNTLAEINAEYVQEHGIQVVRRLSGGGTVYHDLGNLNFTFIVDNCGDEPFDFATFCSPVVKALKSIGVEAEVNGRNDITIDGKKFSGNSQYSKQGRTMHHGTIMYDSDLDVVQRALRVKQDKLESKGIRSVQSRVTNVRPYVKEDISMACFFEIFKKFMFEEYDLQEYCLTEDDVAAVELLRQQIYDRWEWNYGASPDYRIHKERRIEGCGQIEVFMDVEKGILQRLEFYGDYFGEEDPAELATVLMGCRMEEQSLRDCLKNVDIQRYFRNMKVDSFLKLLLV